MTHPALKSQALSYDAPKLRRWIVAILLLQSLLPGCKDDSTAESDDPMPEGDIVLDVLFADVQEFKYIFPGFACSDTSGAPWGFAHLGTDVIAAQSGARVLAPADGTVEEVNVYMNPRNNQWQVNVRVRYNSTFVYHVLFEPRAPSESENALQRSAIPISPGQKVHKGDLLGRQLDLSHGDLSAGEAGIHFDVWKGNDNICPQPYFTANALAQMMNLLHAKFPNASLCYP